MNFRSFPVLTFTLMLAAICSQAQDAPVRLTNQEKEVIFNQVIPTYRLSNPANLLKIVAPLAESMSERVHRGANQLLADKALPSIEFMLADARLALIQEDTSDRLPPPSRIELPALRKMLAERIQDVLNEQDAHAMMAAKIPTPKNLKEYEKLFREIDALNNRLISVRRFASYAKALTATNATKVKIPTQTEIDQRRQDLQERTIELRIQRLKHAIAVFKPLGPQNRVIYPKSYRFHAAHILDIDHKLIEDFYNERAKYGKPFLRNSLQDPNQRQELSEQVRVAKTRAGDLVDKSRKLHAALYWWLRGRYGTGVKFYGLVKSDLAKTIPAAQNQIYMPTDLEEVSQSQGNDSYKYPNRRHHYWWNWEERTLMVQRVAGPVTSKQPSTQPTTPTAPLPTTSAQTLTRAQKVPARQGPSRFGTHFSGTGPKHNIFLTSTDVAYDRLGWTLDDLYKRLGYERPKPPKSTSVKTYRRPSQTPTVRLRTYIPQQDPNAIYQLVGFTEYAQALQQLDSLIKTCTHDEREAIDSLIAQQQELQVEINQSRNVERQSSLSEKARGEKDDFKRYGLKWVTALARAEVAAMLVGFADQHDAFTRFAADYDRDAYKEMLMDGMRTHYWSLAKDADLEDVLAGRTSANRTLAYYRRLLVAKALLNATAQLKHEELTPAQRAELQVWKLKLNQLQSLIAKRIARFHS